MPLLAAVVVPHPPIIVPKVGKGEEKKLDRTTRAYREAMAFLARFEPETVVLASPHTVMYADYFHLSPGAKASGGLRRFGAPGARVEADYDTDLVREVERLCRERGIAAGTLGERDPELDHGSVIPLLFLNDCLQDYRLVRVGLSGLSMGEHYRLGQAISDAAGRLNRRIVLVASGDLSHKLLAEGPYGFSPQGPVFDHEVTERLGKADFLGLMEISPNLCDAATQCGLGSFVIMAGAFDGRKVAARMLSYEGPFGVGYAVGTFEGQDEDPERRFLEKWRSRQDEVRRRRREREDGHVRLARLAVETFVRERRLPELPDNLPEDLARRRAAVFVSIHKHGHLRGCIGRTQPRCSSVAQEILEMGAAAAAEDHRFPPVRTEELEDLVYSVDVLETPEPVASPEELDPKIYGVVVRKGRRSGLLLPDLEGVDTVAEQIRIAREKAGIGRHEAVELFRIRVARHE